LELFCFQLDDFVAVDAAGENQLKPVENVKTSLSVEAFLVVAFSLACDLHPFLNHFLFPYI
jgi:hypothetical protein